MLPPITRITEKPFDFQSFGVVLGVVGASPKLKKTFVSIVLELLGAAVLPPTTKITEDSRISKVLEWCLGVVGTSAHNQNQTKRSDFHSCVMVSGVARASPKTKIKENIRISVGVPEVVSLKWSPLSAFPRSGLPKVVLLKRCPCSASIIAPTNAPTNAPGNVGVGGGACFYPPPKPTTT